MPFTGTRVKALRDLRGMTQKELAAEFGVRQSQVSEWEGGTEPTYAQLEKLSDLFDCTMDFLFRRRRYKNVDLGSRELREAASEMAFEVFADDIAVSVERREQCRRVLGHETAPVTSTAWRHLAEQIDLALGPSPTGARFSSGRR